MEPRPLIELTAEVAGSYFRNNSIQSTDVPIIIRDIHSALARAEGHVEQKAKPDPAVDIKKSIKPDAITCLECGKKFKSLKRHIGAEHGLDHDEYRKKWSLSRDYPMVAPIYSDQRRKLAIDMGLGTKKEKLGARGKRKAA